MGVSSLFILFFMIVNVAVLGASQDNTDCVEFYRCGDTDTIKFPFRLRDRQPSTCGYPGFDVSCTSKNKLVLELPLALPIKLYVAEIDYSSQQLQVYNPNFYGHIPKKPSYNLESLNLSTSPFRFTYGFSHYTLLNCSQPFGSFGRFRVPCSPRWSGSGDGHCAIISNTHVADYSDVVNCSKMYDFNAPVYPYSTEMRTILHTFSLTWSTPNCAYCEKTYKGCRLAKYGAENKTECFDLVKERKGLPMIALVISGSTVGSFLLLLMVIAILYVQSSDKKERENQKRIEKFLEDYLAFKPSRYAYVDIKRITENFKNKLGQGAYGTVFKGKLSNDILVAVKILNNISKGNGAEFINEVTTMGRIHHINVVRLVGYCADGFRRALVYEYLPNDSLEKYISHESGHAKHSLSWEILQDIALGIAKGIEYLHQGCDQRILHFDIKPHNILLDQNFAPKISDFGMAKLCSKDQSIVSMTTARGTMGYIAPEVFSRNFGNVSYKSDVYSFGMLLLEMVGGRKNTNIEKEVGAQEIYYPEWIYNLLEEGGDLRIHIDEEGDARIAKKLAMVGLWCIQWHPVGRPTMKVVVQMLGGGEKLTMPPNPFASTGPSTTNNKMPIRRRALELEAIAE